MLAPHYKLGLLLVGALLVSAVFASKAVLVYRYEASQFRSPRQRPPKPDDAAALGLRDLELRLKTGLFVCGWFIPSRNGAAVVFVHGSPSDRAGLLPEARALARAGYGAVLLDVPGHGESTGRATWGEPARDALRAAVDFALAQPGIEYVGAYGFSMGSGVVALGAAEDPRIAAVVLAGSFTTIEEQLRHEFRKWGWVSVLPALWAARRAGLAMDELRPIDTIGRLAPRPVLIVAGTRDWAIPERMPRALYLAAREPKQLLMVEGGSHGDYAQVMGSSYFERLREFFDGFRARPRDTLRSRPRDHRAP